MHTKYMQYIKRRCQPIEQKPKHRITIALNPELWERFQPSLKNNWGDSFTSWVEFAMECYSREKCDGCPYQEEEDQEKSGGIGKVLNK